jgi:hypothetical protein
MYAANQYVVRAASKGDERVLRELAALDSQRPLSGPTLIGELDGEPAAALALSDGRVVADPLRPTGALRQALRLRASAVTARSRTPALEERIRVALAGFRARAERRAASAGC